MKFKVNSSILLKSLNKVNSVVPAKTPLPILENILFDLKADVLTLSATDLEVSMTTTVTVTGSQDGKVAVPAKRLIDTLKALPETSLAFDINDLNQITFSTDRGTYKLSGENGEEFPSTPDLETGYAISISSKQLARMINHTLFAVSTDELRQAMMGVLFQINFDEFKTVATDGHRLVAFSYKAFSSEENKNFIIPSKALNILLKNIDGPETPITIDEKFVSFKFEEGTLTSRLIKENYPNYEAVIPNENNRNMVINNHDLKAGVKRVSLFANSSTHQIRFAMGEEPLKIFAEDFDQGRSAKENIPSLFTGESLEIGFNANYIQDILDHIETDEVRFEFSGPTRASVVLPAAQEENENILMLVMPVRINS